MCKYCEYGRYESDDKPCCEEYYLNRKSHIVYYKDLYRKSDFLCEGCIKLYCDRKYREMLGIREIVSIKEYNATISYIAINGNYMNGIILSLLKMEISIYYVMDALGFL